ncbi:MAG TPA: ABC transporter ATP-binding protein [Magnetospirillaceae bacterium]|nr:ABC transporter ATP-binding protein [Magnetospirillaceae bacterium]
MGTSLKSLRIFWRANRAHPGLFFGTIGVFTTGMILQKITLPLIGALALDKLITIYTTHPADYWGTFTPYLISFAAAAILGQACNDVALWLLSKLETLVRPELQMRIFNLLINQSLNFHANNFSGSLVSQTIKFTSAYVTLTDVFTINVIMTTVMSLVAIGVVAFFLPWVALAMLGWTIFFVWVNITLTRKRIHLSRIASEAESVLTGHLADAIGNVAAIKAFARESDESALHSVKNQDRAQKKYRSWIQAVRNDFRIGMMMAALQLGVLGMLIFSAMESTVAIGTLLLVQVYMTQLISQLWGLSGISRNIEQALSDASEMTEILGVELEVKDPAKPQKLRVSKGALAFNDVTFKHDGSNDALFNNFSLSVKPGEKIGLVGHSGSGKTSLTRLLLRFVDIDGGTITIDGQDIAQVTQADVRSHIAYVPQEPLLFHRSLRENIAYGAPAATDEAIVQAAKLAHADEFIQTLPQGYDTMVGERGVKLSGGQRQRIAIARAILKDAPILVLDEATSALDSESEKLIQDALKKLMKGRTTLVIAHRLSTIQTMNRIVVLENGVIREQGSHAELLKTGGVYAGLWQHQSGGFLEE